MPPIDHSIVDAILSGRLPAGARLGKQSSATLFSAPRTLARDAFAARRAIEEGVLTTVRPIGPEVLASLREHGASEETDALSDLRQALRPRRKGG